MKRIAKILGILGLLLLLEANGVAQNDIPLATIENANCESNVTYISSLRQDALGAGSKVLVSSHRSMRERREVGRRRLVNAQTMLTNGFLDGDRSIVVETREHPPQNGKGYLDFFLGGKLHLRIFLQRNADLILGPCAINIPYETPCSSDFAKMFYPCKKSRQ